MTKTEYARAYILQALAVRPMTAKQITAEIGYGEKHMRGIFHEMLDKGLISAARTGNWYTYYIADTAPKPKQSKAKVRHRIPTKVVTVRQVSFMSAVAAVVTLPAAPWEVSP